MGPLEKEVLKIEEGKNCEWPFETLADLTIFNYRVRFNLPNSRQIHEVHG
jgi:hypothetical protein